MRWCLKMPRKKKSVGDRLFPKFLYAKLSRNTFFKLHNPISPSLLSLGGSCPAIAPPILLYALQHLPQSPLPRPFYSYSGDLAGIQTSNLSTQGDAQLIELQDLVLLPGFVELFTFVYLILRETHTHTQKKQVTDSNQGCDAPVIMTLITTPLACWTLVFINHTTV